MVQRCRSCARIIQGDVRFCSCLDGPVLGLRRRPAPSEPSNKVVQGVLIVAIQLAFFLLLRPLLGS